MELDAAHFVEMCKEVGADLIVLNSDTEMLIYVRGEEEVEDVRRALDRVKDSWAQLEDEAVISFRASKPGKEQV